MLADRLYAAGVPVFPCRANKHPAVNKGESWKDYAAKPPSAHNWPSPLVGVPIPQGAVVIDLDTYKGVTRQAVEQLLGCALEWDRAFIQKTPQGGQHYAFAVDWVVRFGSNIAGVKGLDTRTLGPGYICTGGDYQHINFGPYALAHPHALPRLPDETRHILEHVEQAPSDRVDLPEGDRDIETIKQALSHLDPGCERTSWIRIGLALRHQFHDDPDTGHSLFDLWSSGGLHNDEEPGNYDSEGMQHQWDSFKPEGGVTIATLFYSAMAKGWRPPAGFDTSIAFGADSAAVDLFADMIDRITEEGGNPKHVDNLIADIGAMPCSPIQRDLLVQSLKFELKEARLLDKKLGDKIDKALRTDSAPAISAPPVALPGIIEFDDIPECQLSRPSGVHGTNALLMLKEIFNDRIARMCGQLRWWSGREWQQISDDQLETITFMALMPDQSKKQNVSGTISAIKALCPKLDEQTRDRRIYFRNCVLNFMTGQTSPHDRQNANTGTLQTDFMPGDGCPEWFKFLDSLWGDADDGVDRSALLQEIIGWTMFKDNLNVQKVIAFEGASRGGKGAIVEVMNFLLGKEASGPIAFCNLHDGKTQSAFRHIDVAFDAEAKPPDRQNIKQAIGFMNKLASNEELSIQLLNNQTPWRGRLNCKLVISCNGIPTMLDDSGATVNRFKVLKFTRTFVGREDKELVGRLSGELSGISLWALDGAVRLIRNGGNFTEPATSSEATIELKETNQPLREFITDHLEFKRGEKCHLSDIWAAYRLYAADANVKLPQRQVFYQSLGQTLLGSDVEKKHAVRLNGKVMVGYVGIKLSDRACPFPLKVAN